MRLSSTADHCATPEGPDGRGVRARRHDEAAPGAWCFRVGCARLCAGWGPGTHEVPGPQLAATTSGIRNGFPQPPQTIGACASTDGTTRTLRPQSQTAFTRTPPPDEPCRAASAAEAPGGVARGRRRVGLEGALETLRRRAVAALRLGGERDQREAAARVRLLGVVKAQLLGDGQEPAVVVPPGSGRVAHATRGGDAVDCLVQQSLEGEFVPARGRRLPDQGLGRGKIGQFGVVPLNVGPRLCQLCGENRWCLCRAHVMTTSLGASVFRFRGIPNNLHVPVSCR